MVDGNNIANIFLSNYLKRKKLKNRKKTNELGITKNNIT